MNSNEIQQLLLAQADEQKAIDLARFFKTGKGQYGENDKFMGITVPKVRAVARLATDLPLAEVSKLLHSQWHEMRLCGLLILTLKCRREVSREVFDFYLAHTKYINNWDLVDLSAPQIIGGYLIDKPRSVLDKLAESSSLWENRIAMVATYTFIKANDLDETYRLATLLMHHSHDLMHKAVGWMLREAGKRDKQRLYDYVELHRLKMPRTMLRYAIEKFDSETRKWLMRKDKAIVSK